MTGEPSVRGGLARLNDASGDEAREALLACCGSREWSRRMADARPFASVDALMRAAGDVWRELGPADWHEAFSAHPRIGESRRILPGETATSAWWSAVEQAGVGLAGPRVLESLAEANERYERRFGHIFLVCATRRSAAEILAELESRLSNEPARELDVAAAEQQRITAIRLARLIGDELAH
jgi:OHCU decarboxylase